MNTRIVNCEKHGDYEQTEENHFLADSFPDYADKKIWVGNCKKCEEHEKERRLEFENEKKNAEKLRIKTKRRSDANIPERYLFKSFDNFIAEDEKQKHAKEKFISLSEKIKSGKGFNIIACGSVGTGKTLLSCALIDSLVDSHKCKIVTVMNIIRALKASWKNDSEYSESDVIEHYCGLDLLIIDEIGVQFNSETEKLFIFDIINGRYNKMLPTVLLSNLAIEGVKGILGERCIDRLRDDGGQLVVFNWDSARGKK